MADHLLLQDDRKICFVVDYEGGAGKIVLAKLFLSQYKTFDSTGGKLGEEFPLSYFNSIIKKR